MFNKSGGLRKFLLSGVFRHFVHASNLSIFWGGIIDAGYCIAWDVFHDVSVFDKKITGGLPNFLSKEIILDIAYDLPCRNITASSFHKGPPECLLFY